MTKPCDDLLDREAVRLIARRDFQRVTIERTESVSTSVGQPNGQVWRFVGLFESFHDLESRFWMVSKMPFSKREFKSE
jgi:hypothetical protein